MSAGEDGGLWGSGVVAVTLSLPVCLELGHELRAAVQVQPALGAAQRVAALLAQHLLCSVIV